MLIPLENVSLIVVPENMVKLICSPLMESQGSPNAIIVLLHVPSALEVQTTSVRLAARDSTSLL
jgi:hypothetical protein